jgi:phospholipid/cholesterol/gamma-HCH transport system substrate-binding protein
MNRRFNEMQVGIFTIVALIILIAGMMWFKNMSLTTGQVLYQADFPEVAGLREGDKVQVRGIRMGEVSELAMLPGAVRVSFLLKEGAPLKEDATITLGEKGIVGEVVIEIDPGVGAEAPEGHIFQGRTAGTIASMTDAAGDALVELRELTQKVTALVDEVQEQGKVTETLTQANETLDKVDTMVEENHQSIRVILENLRLTTDELRELAQSGRIQQTLDDASSAAASADSMMITMEESGRRLNSILAKIDEGEGTAAMLLNDPSLYMTADSTMTSLKRLLDEMRRNPKKYFKVKVF